MRRIKFHPKHKRFLVEFLLDGNGTRAALAAGYAARSAAVTAHRLLRREDVRTAIEAQQGVDAARLGIERHDVISGLHEAFRMAREHGEPAVMVSATRELGRMLGLYPAEKRRVSAGRPPPDDVRLLSDAELDAAIGAAQ